MNKDNIKCKLIYDSKKDGDKAETFHSLCDNKGATLTIISTSDNKKIGGFLSVSFGGNKGYISDKNAFLFSLNYDDQENNGPIFGSVCIYISDCFLSNKRNYYSPYTCRYDFGQRNNNQDFNFSVLDLEVYQIFK